MVQYYRYEMVLITPAVCQEEDLDPALDEGGVEKQQEDQEELVVTPEGDSIA